MYSQDVTALAQLQNFAYAFLVGASLSVVYDVFRAVRLISPKGKILNFICDVLFMAIASLVSFSFCVVVNDGIIRFYLLLGEAIGFFAFMMTIGRLTGVVMRLLKKYVNGFNRIISKPFKLFYGKLSFLFKKIVFFCRKKMKKSKKKI